MYKIKTIVAIIFLGLFATNVLATDKNKEQTNHNEKLRDPAEFQKIIEEYKEYPAKISPEVRDEIIAFRKEIAKLNKEKKLLYKKLSQTGQDYLKMEQQYKKKLPVKHKNIISIKSTEKNKS